MATIGEKIRNLFREAGDEAAAIAEKEGDGQHIHVHVGDQAPATRRRTRDRDQEVPAATETITAENPPPIEQIDQPPPRPKGEGSPIAETVSRHDDEIEQLLEANEIEREAIESLAGGAGDSAYDAAPFRDGMAKAAAIRDQIRKGRGKLRDQAAPTPLPEASPTGGTGQPDFEMEAPPGTLDHARRATDSAWMQTSWDETISWAEILRPGLRLPTFDARARPRQTFNALCAFRARVLDAAYADPEGREIIDGLSLGFAGGGKLSCQDAKALLKQAAFVKGRINSAPSGLTLRPTVDTMGTNLGGAIAAGPSLADYQKQIDAHYRGQRG